MTEPQKNEPLTEKQLLDILGTAISDVGYWSWWTTDLPTVIQIEFGGTQLYFAPTDNTTPPDTQIAIQFKNPKSISFLTRQESEVSSTWFDDLHADKIESPACSWDYFSFTDNDMILAIIKDAKHITTINGYSPKDNSFLNEKYKLAFWAGDYGFAAAADEIKLLTKVGKIQLEQIPEAHNKWWTYWQEYWKLRDTKNPLPKDFACEVTIPMKND